MEVYRHFKGGIYLKLCEAIDSETGDISVIYSCTKTGLIYSRPKDMFYDIIERDKYYGPRFYKIN